MRNNVILLVAIIGILGVAIFTVVQTAKSSETDVACKIIATVPGAAEQYPPQGLTAGNGRLYFSNHWKDTKSVVYELDLQTGSVLRSIRDAGWSSPY